jgi:transcriptional regulator with XRE-family HTH domain
MRSREEVEQVLTLAAEGLTKSAIARATGVSRATVRDWLAGHIPRSATAGPTAERPWEAESFAQLSYSYLLGLYLGDGYLSPSGRATSFRIFFDARYPAVIGEAVRAVRRVQPQNRVWVFRQVPTRCVVVQSCSTRWPALFPQHGPGFKHDRPIALVDWQKDITAEHPESFLRGLLHSDGCRSMNTVTVNGRSYSYPRYSFSNRSEDIKAILCEHLDLLEISWRRMGRWQISVARREAVARLDEFVGPKR